MRAVLGLGLIGGGVVLALMILRGHLPSLSLPSGVSGATGGTSVQTNPPPASGGRAPQGGGYPQ